MKKMIIKLKPLSVGIVLLTTSVYIVLLVHPTLGPVLWEKTGLENWPATYSFRQVEKPTLSVDDVCLTVKTTKKNHESRVELILKTWFKIAKGQVFLMTDGDDEHYQKKTGNKLVVSRCGASHGLRDLCCKTGLAYDTCMADKDKKWWCSIDDDNYVHVDRLLEYLGEFDPDDQVYIGRKSRPFFKSKYKSRMYEYEFGTGGAGVCISRSLAERIRPWFGVEAFPLTCQEVGAADDCVTGFVITKLMGASFTESLAFHSHFEDFRKFPVETLHEQVIFSYRGDNVLNLTGIDAAFTTEEDPTRLMSLHCHLHPQDPLCHKK